MHEQLIACMDTLVKNPKHIPVITFSSMTAISSSASQASSLASLIQMRHSLLFCDTDEWKGWIVNCNEFCIL